MGIVKLTLLLTELLQVPIHPASRAQKLSLKAIKMIIFQRMFKVMIKVSENNKKYLAISCQQNIFEINGGDLEISGQNPLKRI